MIRIVFGVILLSAVLSSVTAKEEKKGWGLSLGEGTSNIRIGGRLQGVGLYNPGGGESDFYLRRARVNLQYQTQNSHMVYVELRNDNSTKEDQGEGTLFIGDAFYEIPIKTPFIHDITLFRSKVDVSYSQTSSSKNLINPNRARSSDYAANFIVHNRRANNIQINGGNSWFSYQLVISDGIQSEEVEEPFGTVTVSGISKQRPAIGGKFRFFIWGEKAELQETYYEAKRTLSLGLGVFTNPKITYSLSNGQELSHSRSLFNGEMSLAIDKFRILAEGFFFKGDTLNLSQGRIGDSWGSYMRSEYIMGKWAPFIGFNYLKRDNDSSQTHETSQLIGLNYYAQKKTRRYGMSFENFEYGRLLSTRNKREFTTYIMLDY